jgi:5-hydroxyisourate hydrolase
MTRISTHILDIVHGKPASGVAVRLEMQAASGSWQAIASGSTDQDGRCSQLVPAEQALTSGVYRLVFDTGPYYSAREVSTLYPAIEVTFQVRDGESHFHIPLLLSPNSYTTYRGS